MNSFTKLGWSAVGITLVSAGTAAAEPSVAEVAPPVAEVAPPVATVSDGPAKNTQGVAKDFQTQVGPADAAGEESPETVPSTSRSESAGQGQGGGEEHQASPPLGTSVPASREARITECIAHHEQAQLTRLNGQYLESTRELTACAAPDCPEALRADCLQWRRELDLFIPTIIIDLEGGSGAIDAAQVLIDGRVVTGTIEGRPIALDPGTYVLKVSLADGRSKQQRIVLAEGERARRILFSFEPPPQDTTPRGPEAPTITRPVPPGVYILGAAAFVGLGVGVGFGSDAWSKSKTARDLCAPLCDEDVSRAVSQRAAIADVALAVSVASAVGAVVVYSYRPSRVVPSGRVSVGWVPSQGGGAMRVEGAF